MHDLVTHIDPTVLERVIDACEKTRGAGVVVFDLDSTLLDNRPRQAQILREFGVAAKVAVLESAEPGHWTSWDIRDAMQAAGMKGADIDAHAEAAKTFWRERFFTSHYAEVDDAVSGAQAYVARLVTTGVHIVYVTGRHEDMRNGSVVAFRRLGFPVPGPGVQLLMKPTFEQSDDAWKEEAYARLRQIGRVVAAFDNEPTHINGYERAFPEAICVHLATDHSGRPVTLGKTIRSVAAF